MDFAQNCPMAWVCLGSPSNDGIFDFGNFFCERLYITISWCLLDARCCLMVVLLKKVDFIHRSPKIFLHSDCGGPKNHNFKIRPIHDKNSFLKKIYTTIEAKSWRNFQASFCLISFFLNFWWKISPSSNTAPEGLHKAYIVPAQWSRKLGKICEKLKSSKTSNRQFM